MENPVFEDDEPAKNVNEEKPIQVLKTEMVEEKGLGSKELKREMLMIMKNIVIISFAFMLLFTAYQSMASLQSSINKVTPINKYISFIQNSFLL
jgi:hypothetical protein